jgi:uncharacterized protein involved in tolerance to divalent cations
MINLVIYLKKEQNASLLIEKLFQQELIGMASIDENNSSYVLNEGKVQQMIHTVITVQTKALLFSEITKLVESEYGTNVPINCLPIVGSNGSFDHIIRENTKKI